MSKTNSEKTPPVKSTMSSDNMAGVQGVQSASSLINNVEKLDINSSNMQVEWKHFATNLKIFMRANNFENETEARKVAILLACIGSEALEIFYSFNVDIDKITFEELLKKFEEYFLPKVNITMERHKLFNRKQGQNEDIASYATDIKNISLQCGFEELRDNILKDVFSWNLNSNYNYIREKLLTNDPKTFQDSIDLAKKLETSRQQAKVLQGEQSSSSQSSSFVGNVNSHKKFNNNLNHFRRSSRSVSPARSRHSPVSPVKQRNVSPSISSKNCHRCGQIHRVRCPAIGVICSLCRKPNHFAKVLAALAAQSINISVGFCQGFSAVLLPQYTHEYPAISYEQSSWIASLGVISNPIGALLGGMMVDAVGRRLLLQSIVLPNLIGWLVIAFSETYVFLCVGRFITGFTIGMSTVSYIYVAEITTPEKRGVLSALGPGLVSTGIFIVYSLGAFVHWRKVAAICAGVSLLTPFLMYFVPESPLWLASKGQMKEAYNSMFWLRQNNNTAQQELMEFTKDRKSDESMTFRQKMGLFKRRSVLKPFALLIVFFVFQEMSGIYIILYYAVDFFKSVGTSVNEFTASIIVGGVRVFMGAVGACLINSFRRKTLAAASGLLLGFAMLGAAICDSLNGPPLIKLACVLLHVSFSMVGFLQLPWIMSGELYPQDIRGVMSGATACCAYVLIFFNIKTYPQLEYLLTSNGTLYLFAICAIIGAAYCYLFLPETKGKTLNEIMRQFDEEKKDGDPEIGYVKKVMEGKPVQRRHSAGASISLEKGKELDKDWMQNTCEKHSNGHHE